MYFWATHIDSAPVIQSWASSNRAVTKMPLPLDLPPGFRIQRFLSPIRSNWGCFTFHCDSTCSTWGTKSSAHWSALPSATAPAAASPSGVSSSSPAPVCCASSAGSSGSSSGSSAFFFFRWFFLFCSAALNFALRIYGLYGLEGLTMSTVTKTSHSAGVTRCNSVPASWAITSSMPSSFRSQMRRAISITSCRCIGTLVLRPAPRTTLVRCTWLKKRFRRAMHLENLKVSSKSSTSAGEVRSKHIGKKSSHPTSVHHTQLCRLAQSRRLAVYSEFR
mmetsp:Transcript_99806/g.229096  ORF Transcript_99806/g.229096 Transcript_99806/m.229096 type:complete len:276 (+) Transcript_99806:984-1811(+)